MSYPTQDIRRKTPPPRLSEAELRQRSIAAFPESAGPAEESESGEALYGDRMTRHARVGQAPRQRSLEDVWKERAQQEAARAAVPPEVREAKALIEAEMRAGRRF